jgi:hypothetical protein
MNTRNSISKIYIDPPSPAYLDNRLFDLSNKILNRDDSLLPYWEVRESFRKLGIEVNTADFLPSKPKDEVCEYYSFGGLAGITGLLGRQDVILKAFLIFEPPIVDPRLYESLPFLATCFEEVYVHNVNGEGYSLDRVDRARLKKLYWPQPRKDVMLEYWKCDQRQHRIVVINGSHVPRRSTGELYSKRIEGMAELAKSGKIDLYGRGWDRWWSRSSMWLPYWKNRHKLMSIYQGPCQSKYETLAKYSFSLCFENMEMLGYVTEKIFDCFYAGTVPIYLGAKDIRKLIPESSYIDFRNYNSWTEMLQHIESMAIDQILEMKHHGREFLLGMDSKKYQNSLLTIFNPMNCEPS